jgi:putative membrane protein
MSAFGDPRHRVPATLLLVFALVWAGLAWRPSYRSDWLLENMLVFVGVPLLVHGYSRLRLSDASYVLLFVFLCLHEVGAHYTYAEVPIGYGWFGSTRNHFDRLVHFSFGLLLLPSVVEILHARAQLRGLWRYLVPVTFIMACSELFEMIEWQAAEIFGGPLGQAYLGAQGDIWDAQKDSGLAMLGALLSMLLLHALAARRPWGLPAP